MFDMIYEDMPKARQKYPFLESSTRDEILMLLTATMKDHPEDTVFSDACRLELLFRLKQAETKDKT